MSKSVQTLEAALKLVRALEIRRNVHLGRSRYSGISGHCIACICDLALGASADSDCVNHEEFDAERVRLETPDEHSQKVVS